MLALGDLSFKKDKLKLLDISKSTFNTIYKSGKLYFFSQTREDYKLQAYLLYPMNKVILSNLAKLKKFFTSFYRYCENGRSTF